MRTILAIDPGTTESGWCLFDGGVLDSGVTHNEDMLSLLMDPQPDTVAIEYIESYGMAVGKEVFATCVWVGRFIQAWREPDEVLLVPRRTVKMHLCQSPRAKDANIRASLIDKFGPGKEAAIGKKSNPGPLYGVKSHVWAALAVAVTVHEGAA